MTTTTTRAAALDLIASLVLEDARRWGEVAVLAQWRDARSVLDPDSLTPYSFLTRARGYSKTADLAGMSIAAMLTDLPAGSRLYAIASDLDQGRLLVDSVRGFAARTPELAGALVVETYKVTAARSGSTLEVLAADAPGAYGLRPAFLVVDELAQWAATPGPRRLWEATTSALAKVPGARLVVLTSAGDPAHWSYKVLEHARVDPLWRVHEVPGPAPWADRDRLAEQRRRLPASSYARLFDNVWSSAEDRLANLDDLRACVTLDGPLLPQQSCRYVIGVDLGLKRDRSVAAVAHSEPVRASAGGAVTGARIVLDRMEVWAGTVASPVQLGAVEEWCAQAAAMYRPVEVVLDPWQAVGLAQRLRGRGITTSEFVFSAQSVGRLAGTLHLAIRNRTLALPDDEELLDELANVRLRETSPGVPRMDHDAGRHDDRAIALALAATRLLERATGTLTAASVSDRSKGDRLRAGMPGDRAMPGAARGPRRREARIGGHGVRRPGVRRW